MRNDKVRQINSTTEGRMMFACGDKRLSVMKCVRQQNTNNTLCLKLLIGADVSKLPLKCGVTGEPTPS